jgi:hypothetical protein
MISQSRVKNIQAMRAQPRACQAPIGRDIIPGQPETKDSYAFQTFDYQ